MELTLNKGMWLNENINSEKKQKQQNCNLSFWRKLLNYNNLWEYKLNSEKTNQKNNKTTIYLSEVSIEFQQQQQHTNSIKQKTAPQS